MRLSQGRLKLGSTFKQIVSSHNIKDPKKTKPHPYMVKLILEKQRVKPEEALLVGDSRQDILMAKAAGLRTVAVLTGHLTKKEAKDLKVSSATIASVQKWLEQGGEGLTLAIKTIEADEWAEELSQKISSSFKNVFK